MGSGSFALYGFCTGFRNSVQGRVSRRTEIKRGTREKPTKRERERDKQTRREMER